MFFCRLHVDIRPLTPNRNNYCLVHCGRALRIVVVFGLNQHYRPGGFRSYIPVRKHRVIRAPQMRFTRGIFARPKAPSRTMDFGSHNFHDENSYFIIKLSRRDNCTPGIESGCRTTGGWYKAHRGGHRVIKLSRTALCRDHYYQI